MKKFLLTSVLFISAFSAAFAQAINITPNDTFSSTAVLVSDIDQIESDGFVENTTNNYDTICWYVNDINHPQEWELSVCDKELCSIIVTTGELHFFTAPAHVQQILHFLATPYCVPGNGNIELTMWLKSDSAHTVVHPRFFVTYTGACTTGFNKTENEEAKIYPTNFQSHISVSGIEAANLKSVKLFNALGQIMNINPSYNDAVLNIETAKLYSGVYILRIETTKGIISKKMVKQ